MVVVPTDFAKFAGALGVNFIGANCGIGPAELLRLIRGSLNLSGELPVVAKSNCGVPEYADSSIHYHGTPEVMAEYAMFARDVGAKIIGGTVAPVLLMLLRWLQHFKLTRLVSWMNPQWSKRLVEPGLILR